MGFLTTRLTCSKSDFLPGGSVRAQHSWARDRKDDLLQASPWCGSSGYFLGDTRWLLLTVPCCPLLEALGTAVQRPDEILTQCVLPFLSFGDLARSSLPPVNADNGAGAEGALDLCSAKLSQTEGPLFLGCGSTQVRVSCKRTCRCVAAGAPARSTCLVASGNLFTVICLDR